ncbi:MAG: hypothetical protein Fur002_17700 [Anaerolineales bacterium]
MNLDDLNRFKELDSENRLGEIDSLPDALLSEWKTCAAELRASFSGVANIVIAASGEAAQAAELAAACAPLPVPLKIVSGGALPAFAKGASTLTVCMGDEEETRQAFDSALKNGCAVFVISCGGLEQLANEKNLPRWKAARAALPHSFAALMALFRRLNFIPDLSAQVEEAASAMKDSQAHLRAEVLAASNPAKRYAGQLVGRWATIVCAESLAPAARRWKANINRMAKAPANVEILPEANYHAAQAVWNPAELLNAHTMTLFLRAPLQSPREMMRSDMMRQNFMLEGLNTDFVDARGNSPLAQLWTLILFGDYMAYYLAMAYGVGQA